MRLWTYSVCSYFKTQEFNFSFLNDNFLFAKANTFFDSCFYKQIKLFSMFIYSVWTYFNHPRRQQGNCSSIWKHCPLFFEIFLMHFLIQMAWQSTHRICGVLKLVYLIVVSSNLICHNLDSQSNLKKVFSVFYWIN